MTIKCFMFDVYGTLFNVRSIDEQINHFAPGHGEAVGALWRKKQVEHAFLRQLTETYKPFSEITEEALYYAAAAYEQTLTETEAASCLEAYKKLAVYPEVPPVLDRLKDFQLAVVSNGSRDMLEPLVQHSTVAPYVNHIISADDIQVYKPNEKPYIYALETLNVKPSEALFVSGNSWDILGAHTAGLKTAWVNRGNGPFEFAGFTPDDTMTELDGLLRWVW
ncbi:2-haloacid dehalogenase [Salsuginibacillus halophilus]|uniref:2-haloacid dehalogenase n=1 Tax=Salsuginibacillus halophilus TaxID=517424 RepID=A0A2P8HW81_9BACI|nr:haloacid dehalogenase type II [Salsuginibacillus halophilus]PSL50438.1 2-haloacid dehalogenase [Salsuginibacillus halophilus]